MKTSRLNEEGVACALRLADSGMLVADSPRQSGNPKPAFYKQNKQYGNPLIG